MVDPESSQFGRAALRSGLLDAETISKCYYAIPEAKRTPDAIDRRMARQAIAAGYLSLWQAQQMLSGRTLGFKVDKYVLLDMIGQGGMGRVYLAKDTRLGRNVALKVLSRERMNNARAIARFQREAKVGAQLQHENLVRVYDEGQAQNVRYLVMEYIEGSNVGRVVTENGPLPWPLATRLVHGVACGLEHAYKKGLVHRDVNPFNILVTHDGVAKLTDLGLAFDMADEGNVTRDGATVGTFDYVPPEQARNSHNVDTRSDIYSLGCTFYHILTGQPPFPMPSLPEKLFAHQSLEPEPIHKFAPDVPPGLVAIVAKMMRKSPNDRYPTPRQLIEALEPYADEQTANAIAAAESIADRQRSTPQNPPIETGIDLIASSNGDPASRELPAQQAGALGSFELDFGPQPSLTEGLTGGRTKSRSQSNSDDGNSSTALPLARRKWVIVVGCALLLGILGTVLSLARQDGGSPGRKDELLKTNSAGSDPAETDRNETRPVSKETNPPGKTTKSTRETQTLISVMLPGGESESFSDLASAVNRAIGGRGTVVLGDTSPIQVNAEQTLQVQRGTLVIRAAEGAQPVLLIEKAGKRFWLESLGGATIRLSGLRLQANYGSEATSPKNRAAILSAGGLLSIDHCIIQASGSAQGTTAIRANGSLITVKNSLIDGFDTGLEVYAPPGTEVNLNQSMFIKPHLKESPFGWAIRLKYEAVGGGPNRDKPRKLVLDHCTISAQGAFVLEGFGPASSPTVVLNSTAILARSLIAWMDQSPEASVKGATPSVSVKWTGTSNLYNIPPGAWVVRAPLGSLPIPGTPADFKAWAMSHGESDSREASFSLATDPELDGGDRLAIPSNYALKGESLPPNRGADPSLIGPAVAQSP